MKRLSKLVLGGAVFTLAAVPLTGAQVKAQDAAAENKPFARGERMHGGFAGAPLISIALRNKSELNLGPDQVAELEKIKQHYQSQTTPVREQLMANEKEIAALMQQSPADLIQVKTKIQEGEKYRSELRYLRVEALENGKSVLTAEQQDQLKNLVRARRSSFRGPHGQPS